jgi:hypothetical protein
MTTPSDGATAQSAEQDTSTDEAVKIAADTATATSEQGLDSKLDQLLTQRLDQFGRTTENRIAEIEKREQGRAQQFWNDKLKEDRGELAQFMGDVSQVLDEDQREQLDALRGERRRKDIEDRLDRFERGELQPAAQQQTVMSPEELNVLRTSIEGMMSAAGITGVDVSDSRLWTGYSQNMSVTDALGVASRNLQSVKQQPAPPAQPATPTNPKEAVPPSTASAPATPADDFQSLGDLAVAFRDKQIDSTTYSRLARDKGWL